MSKPVFRENKKHIMNLSFAYFAQRVVKVKGSIFLKIDIFLYKEGLINVASESL